ncbi:WHEP-TRS [Macleaya cordata]|uniref:WHEP-TRS n=1 Tax=Macleaya cordata TaxID=56857 RepID=A0A200Q5J3_MACCD|nr:WHEP-TRS [Macleaya cordata]
MFQVATLFNDAEKVEKELKQNPPPSESDIEAAKLLLVKEKGEAVAQLKSAKASKEEISASVAVLTKAKESLAKLEERSKLKPGLPQKDGKIDYSYDFFARQAFLKLCTFEPFHQDLFFFTGVKWLLDNCLDDMQFMVKNFDKTAIDRLKYRSRETARECYREEV